jgi:FixJ family two-component response regulator
MPTHLMPLQDERTRRQLVYVVDDEPIIAFTLAEILKTNGLDAQHFIWAHEALDAAQQQAPALLLSDVCMPTMNGIELAMRMCMLCPECKVLLLSGNANAADLMDRARYRGQDFELMEKPIRPSMLLAKVRVVLSAASPATGA